MTEYPPSTSLVSMNGPSVTEPDRTVFAVSVPWSWCPPSSLPVAPHFSYQAPISAYQAPYSAVSGSGSFGVSSDQQHVLHASLLLVAGARLRGPLHPSHERRPRQSDTAREPGQQFCAVPSPPSRPLAGPEPRRWHRP